MALSTLICDVDGTLANTERDGHRVAYNQAFAEAGLDWEWSVALYGDLLQVAGGKERMRFYVDRYRPDFRNRSDISQLITQLYVAKTRFFAERVSAEGIPLRTGVLRLLREAQAAGLRLAIATTTNPHNVRALLDANLGTSGWHGFACIATGDMVPRKKPAPDLYQYVLDRLGVHASECVGFEDSAIGVSAARAASIPVVVTINEYTKGQDFTGAYCVLDHLGEPDQPFTVLAGDVGNVRLVDVALLRTIAGR